MSISSYESLANTTTANAKFLYGTNLKYDVIVRVTPDIRYPVYPVFRAYLIAYYDNTPVGQPGEGLILCTHRDANINYFGLAMWCLLQELMTDVRRAMGE